MLPDGKSLASADVNQTVGYRWDVEKRLLMIPRLRPPDNPQPLERPQNEDDRWNHVAFSPDLKILAAALGMGAIILRDLERWPQVEDKVLPGHGIGISALAFSPGGQTLVAAYNDFTITFWDVQSKQPRTQEYHEYHQGGVRCFAFSPDGKFLASGDTDHTIQIWDVSAAQPLGNVLRGHQQEVLCLAFSKDGDTLISAADGDVLISWVVQEQPVLGVPLVNKGPKASRVAFSPDGKTLASAGERGGVLWNAQNRSEITRSKDAPKGHVFAVAFSRDGQVLALTADDGAVVVWEWDAEGKFDEKSRTPQAHKGEITAVALSLDGRTLVSAEVGAIVFWNWDSEGTFQQKPGNQLVPFGFSALALSALALSADGKTLASGGYYGTVVLWDVTKASKIDDLEKPDDQTDKRVESLAFSPDGKTLAVTGPITGGGPMKGSQGLFLWDVKERRILGESLLGSSALSSSQEKEKPTCLAFSPDGKTLASSQVDGSIYLWDLDLVSWIDRARKLADRSLTDDERRRFGIPQPSA